MTTLNLSQKTRNIFLTCLGIGIVSFVWALADNPVKAWHGYVMNYYFFMSVGLGGCFFASIQHLSSAGWSASVRRIPESFSSWLVPAIILFIPILLFGKNIYEWTHADTVAHDALLQAKAPYLNFKSFTIRSALFFLMWGVLGGTLIKNSLQQDKDGGVELTRANKAMSALFIPCFAILFSTMSVDLLMSLEPHWFSTIFGIVCFANLFLTTIAITLIVTINMKKAGYFGESINDNHIHILGLFMFGFVVFHAYVAFSQFMLIWYGNMPEETFFYLKRWENGWKGVALAVLFAKFVIPFVILLPQAAKRKMDRVKPVAYFILLASWVDLYWLVMPASFKFPFFPFREFGVFLGFLGAFGLTVSRFLSQHPIQPQKDPYIHEALHLHQ